MAVAQHHDAVSGTEKQHVANDYAKRLAGGWERCRARGVPLVTFFRFSNVTLLSSGPQVLVSNSLAALSGSRSERVYCDSLNVSVCPLTESGRKVTHRRRRVAPGPLHAWECYPLKRAAFSVLGQRVQSPGPARGLAREAARERICVRGVGRQRRLCGL